MDDTIVSIIIPVYNTEEHLSACIDSILQQTYANWELILVDDGSQDKSPQICDEYADRDIRIRVFHTLNNGPGAARNVGIQNAAGEYISFIDSDDIIDAEFINHLYSLLQESNCKIAQCKFLKFFEGDEIVRKTEPLVVSYRSGIEMNYVISGADWDDALSAVPVWNKMYRRELFDNIRFPEKCINEDEYINYKLLWNAEKIAVSNQTLYYYRQWSSSIMGRPFSVDRLSVLNALEERSAFYKEHGEMRLHALNCKNYYYYVRLLRKTVREQIPNSWNVQNKLGRKSRKMLFHLLSLNALTIQEKIKVIRNIFRQPDNLIL